VRLGRVRVEALFRSLKDRLVFLDLSHSGTNR